MNFFQGIITVEFRDRITTYLQELGTAHARTRLGVLIDELNKFIKKYAAMTPTQLIYYYTFGDLQADTARLLVTAYIALLEIRGLPIKLDRSQLEQMNKIALILISKLPATIADYKKFAKKRANINENDNEQLMSRTEIMGEYIALIIEGLPHNKDPLLQQMLSLLVAHKLLTVDKTGYDIKAFEYLLLLMMLKLDAKVDIDQLFKHTVQECRTSLGQFAKKINRVADELWPEAKAGALAATKLGSESDTQVATTSRVSHESLQATTTLVFSSTVADSSETETPAFVQSKRSRLTRS